MAEFSKQYIENFMPEWRWDFDIDEIGKTLEKETAIPMICEGFGFDHIAKMEDGTIKLHFSNEFEGEIGEFKTIEECIEMKKAQTNG